MKSNKTIKIKQEDLKSIRGGNFLLGCCVGIIISLVFTITTRNALPSLISAVVLFVLGVLVSRKVLKLY